MEKLSVVVITYNEELNIGRCLASVQEVADEIIVLDSFSDDQTVTIARKYGARVLQEPFKGYIQQKNRALELATYPFVLSLDGDEEIDAILGAAIVKCKEDFTFSGYRMKRCTNYCGQFIRHGAWYPDRKVRLFDKRKACWGGLNPHDKVIFPERVALKELPGEILHYSFATAEEHRQQNELFSSIAANAHYSAGRRTNLFKLFFNPAWAFIYSYIIRTGILHPRHGFIIALNQARYTFMKHKKLLVLQEGSDAEYEFRG